jgi:hypothetical protein
MTIKNAIAIGKGLGLLVKVEENRGAAATFRSFLRLWVSIDVSKPLNPGFCITRNDGSTSWISLKYERLDVYYTDCGKIGHKQLSCLAKPEERYPSRYLISLKVNVFSNMSATKIVENQPESHQTPSSSQTKTLNLPCSPSSQPYANLPNILTSSQNSLTPQISALWSHNPIPASNPISPCPNYPSAVKMDNTIETNLKALSVFQKPIKLYSLTTNPSTSQHIPNNSLNPNQIVTS